MAKSKKEAKVTTPKGKAKKPVSKPKKVKEELPVEEVKLTKIQQWYGAQLDEIEKKEGLVSSLEIPYRMSSGLLCLDLALGGGFASGWYSISGSEASAKSTEVMTLLGEAIKNNILTLYFDAEGAVDNKYTVNICKANNLGDIFGERNSKGDWERLPRARYYDENGLEVVFRTMKKLLLRMPEKRYRKDTGQWYLVFDKEGRGGNNKSMTAMGLTPDQSLLKKTGRFWCPVDDPSFQAIFILDSIPSLVPEDIGDDEEKGTQGIGLVARALAQWVPQVRGLIRKKHVLIHVVNQLRDKPMVLFGKPTYEPGGNTIKFASDCRNEISSMAVSGAPGKNWDVGYGDDGSKSTQFGSEDSVEFEGGSDKYAYKKLVNTKNKKGTPFKKCWMRVWFEDGDGQPRGFDPVFDTYCYLLDTGQVEGSRVKKFKVNVKGFEDFEFDWYTFKTMILAETTGNKDLIKEVKEELEVKKLPKLREVCFKQIQSGEASNMIIKLRNGDNELDEDIDDDDDDVEEF